MEQQLVLDRYRPLEELGEGAFGSVVLAWDTRMQRRVAIKRLDIALGRSSRDQAAGLSEARTAAMLNHPNIVTVFDFDTDSDEAFLIMEYVPGPSLAELLDEVDGRLEADEVAAILEDLADALSFAHDNGVLHLDLKPENVLITPEGRAKVADFGISQLSSLSGHGAASGGTYGYMPLEQVEGGEVSERTDEWAIAAIVHEALTGSNPFLPRTPETAPALLRDAAGTVEAAAEADLDPAVDEVLAIALSSAPTDRYVDVAAFADALSPYLGDPQAGRESITEIVSEMLDEESAETAAVAPLGVWDRSQGRTGRALVGLAAAVQGAWLVWTGLTPTGLASGALGAAVALVALGSFLAPSLGIALGLGCLTVGLVVRESWLAAILVPVIGAVWWWFFARRSSGAAVLPLSAPLLGAARLPLAHPLICGFSLPPLEAAVTALLGGAMTFVASAASAENPPYTLVKLSYIADVWSRLPYAAVKAAASSPAVYVALLGWPLAAAVMSVFSARATRGGAMVGAVGGTISLTGAYMLAERIAVATSAERGYQSAEFAAVMTGSLILVSVITALGAPVRGEEEPFFARIGYHEDD